MRIVRANVPKSGGTFSGGVTFEGNLTLASGVDIVDANGNELLSFGQTASAVNEVTITNAATGSGPTIAASGGDTNINTVLRPKGSGNVQIWPTNTATGFEIVNVAANAAVFVVNETDGVKFGTHSALAGETVQGYITIKDAGGTSRKLAVVA